VTEPRAKYAAKTRGRPFERGNPGKPKGAKHKTTLLLESMSQDDRSTIVTKIIRQARSGCRVSQKLIVDRLEPPRKGRAAPFPLPSVKTTGDIVNALAAVTAATAAGTISPDEALQLAGVLEVQRKAIEQQELEVRIAAMEQRFQ
jgi:hypothetical protein